MSELGIDRMSPGGGGAGSDAFTLSNRMLALAAPPVTAPVAPPPAPVAPAPTNVPIVPLFNGPATNERVMLRVEFLLFGGLRDVAGQALRETFRGPTMSVFEENAIRDVVRQRADDWATAREDFTPQEQREIAQALADTVGELAADGIRVGSDVYGAAIGSTFDLAFARISRRRQDAEAAASPEPQPSPRPSATASAPGPVAYVPPPETPPETPSAPPEPAVLGTAALTLGGSTYTLRNTEAGFTVTNPAYGVAFAVPGETLAQARDVVKGAWLGGSLPGPTPPESPLTIAGQPFSIVGANGTYGLRDPAGALVYQLPGRTLAEAAEHARAAYFTGQVPGFPAQSNPLTIGGRRLDVVGSHGDFGLRLPDGAYAGRVRAGDLGGAVDQIETLYLQGAIPGLPPNRLTVELEPGLSVRVFGPGDSGPYGLAGPDGTLLARLRVPTADGGDRHPTSFEEAAQAVRDMFAAGDLADLGLAPSAPAAAGGEPPAAAGPPSVEELVERYRERRRTFPLESEETAREQVLGGVDPATRSFVEQALRQPLEGAVTDVGTGGAAGVPPASGAPGAPGAAGSDEPEGLAGIDVGALAPGEAAERVAAASDAELAALEPAQVSRLRNRLTRDAMEAIAGAPSLEAARDAAAPSLDALARLDAATGFTAPVEGVEGLPAPETNEDFTRQVMAYMTPRDQSRWLAFANAPENQLAVSMLRAASVNATAFNRSEAAMALMNGFSLQDDIMPWLPFAGPGSGIPLVGPDGRLASLSGPDAPPPTIEAQLRRVDAPGTDALVGTQATPESAALDALIAEGAGPMAIAERVGEIFAQNPDALRRLPATTMQAVLSELDRQRALYTGLETGPIDAASRADVAEKATAMRTAIAQIFTSNVAQEGAKIGEITQPSAADALAVASWVNGLSREEIATIPEGLRAALRDRLRMGMFAANDALDPATVTQEIRAEYNAVMPQYRAALDKLDPTLFGPTSGLIDPGAPTDRPLGYLDHAIALLFDSHGSPDVAAYLWRGIQQALRDVDMPVLVRNLGDLLNKYYYSAQNVDGQIGFAQGMSDDPVFLRGNHEGRRYLQPLLLPSRDESGAPIIDDAYMTTAYDMLSKKGFDLTIRSYAEAYGRNEAERESWRAFANPPNPDAEGVDTEAAREWYARFFDYAMSVIPQRDLDLIRDMALSQRDGDFFSTHAGPAPDRPISDQFLTPERIARLQPDELALLLDTLENWNTWTRGPSLGRDRFDAEDLEGGMSVGGHTMLDRAVIDHLDGAGSGLAYADGSPFVIGRGYALMIVGTQIYVIAQDRHGDKPLILTEEEALEQGIIDGRIDPGNVVPNIRRYNILPNERLGRGE